MVDLPQGNSAKYTANFRYSLKPTVEPEEYKELKCKSFDSFDSVCDETMVGIKFNADKTVQCWVGFQTEPLVDQSIFEPEQSKIASPLILAQTDAAVE